MVWVFGNSHERVPIKDLNDVIYFRQKKQYTDQEFEKSADLRKAIQTGKIVQLENKPEIRNSLPDNVVSESSNSAGVSVDIHEIRRVVSEVVAENKSESVDIKGILTNLIPILTETIRQEVSKITVTGGAQVQAGRLVDTFVGPDYIPEISSVGMKSSINVEGKAVDGSGVSDSLELLKKLSKST